MNEELVPNPVVATLDAADGGTIRIYRNGLVDAVDGQTYEMSPGFDNVAECEAWIVAELRESERKYRIRANGDAYARTRDGDTDPATGFVTPTQEAVNVLEAVYHAHITAEPTLTLHHREVAVLWAEIMRRSMWRFDHADFTGTYKDA